MRRRQGLISWARKHWVDVEEGLTWRKDTGKPRSRNLYSEVWGLLVEELNTLHQPWSLLFCRVKSKTTTNSQLPPESRALFLLFPPPGTLFRRPLLACLFNCFVFLLKCPQPQGHPPWPPSSQDFPSCLWTFSSVFSHSTYHRWTYYFIYLSSIIYHFSITHYGFCLTSFYGI